MNIETGNIRVEQFAKGRQVRGIEDRKTVKGSEPTRMGEGGEIKPLTLVAVCGLLATLSAMHLSLATEYAQTGTPSSSYVMILGIKSTAASFAPAPLVKMYIFTEGWIYVFYMFQSVIASVTDGNHTTLLLTRHDVLRHTAYSLDVA